MDYTPYYEDCHPYKKPLIQNQFVEIKGATVRKFRVERWFKGEKHCYEFIDVGEEPIQPFALKPSKCYELIANKTMKIIYN